MKRLPFNQLKQAAIDYMTQELEANKEMTDEDEWEEYLGPEIKNLEGMKKAECLEDILLHWYVDEEDGEDHIIQTQLLLELIVENNDTGKQPDTGKDIQNPGRSNS